MASEQSAVERVVDAARQRNVELRVVTFDQSTHTAEQAARAVGAELGQIVKSLVFVVPDEDRLRGCLALVSGANSVDLARLAAVLGETHIRRASADEARQLTGFSIGGIPPFGHPEALPTVMDPDLDRFASVWAAAGTANAVFEVAPAMLRSLTGAVVAPVKAGARSSSAAARPAGRPASDPAR